MAPIPPMNFNLSDSGPVASPQRSDFFAPITYGAKNPVPAWVLLGGAAVAALLVWRR